MAKQVVIENPIINSPREQSWNASIGQAAIAAADHGRENPQNLIVEVGGERDADKAAEVATARNLCILAINNAGARGRWAFIEIADPWDAKNTIRATVRDMPREQGKRNAQ